MAFNSQHQNFMRQQQQRRHDQQQRQQQQRQQQLQQQQQDQWKRNREAAWAQEEEKKRRRNKRFARMDSDDVPTFGDLMGNRTGISINSSDNFTVRGDMVGGDKYHQVSKHYPRDEKNGFLLFIERGFAFVFAFLIAGAIATGIGMGLTNGEGGPFLLVIAAVPALIFGLVNASQISRFRD